ncbi:hypothetical protein KAZ66_01915 [Candidatus Woesebacteria bacterium]|nr:hypothetical protein [Candidatus Woesebacteria bacterium]
MQRSARLATPLDVIDGPRIIYKVLSTFALEFKYDALYALIQQSEQIDDIHDVYMNVV